MCASEALIEAKMGVCTAADGQPLIYDHTKSDFTINEGIIISKNLKVYNMVRDKCIKNLGMSLEQFHEVVREDSNRRREERRKAREKAGEEKRKVFAK